MNKLRTGILLLIFLVSRSSVLAQPYESIFGKYDTRWTVEWENTNFATYQNFYVAKDTVLSNGYSYKKIVSDNGFTRLLVREDTVTGKVWSVNLNAYCWYPTPLEKLVQDIGLHLGDTFNINPCDMISYGSRDSLYIVDSVYFVSGHKYIRFKSAIPGYVSPGNTSIIFVEGTGPNRSVLWMRADCTIYHAEYLLCAYKDSTQTDYVNQYFGGQCDPVLLGLGNIPADQVIIYPNPVTDKLHIDTELRNADISLKDMTGRDWSIDISDHEIDMRSLPSGIYLLSLINSGQRTVKKIVKH